MKDDAFTSVHEFLLNKFDGGVFHYTSIAAYKDIIATGLIDSKKSLVDKYDAKSFSVRSGLTSVFDLRSHKDEQLDGLRKGAGLYTKAPYGVILKLSTPLILPVLKTYSEMKPAIEALKSPLHIPYVESYLIEPVSIDAIEKVFVFDCKEFELTNINSDYDFKSELVENERYRKESAFLESLGKTEQ